MVVPDSPLMRSFGVVLIACFLIISSAGTATAQATTDPIEGICIDLYLRLIFILNSIKFVLMMQNPF
jgi:hypothetical protein